MYAHVCIGEHIVYMSFIYVKDNSWMVLIVNDLVQNILANANQIESLNFSFYE